MSNANNKRIAKNTLMLYSRMIMIMVVSLYTSRILLHALGVEDLGVYSIIAGVIVLFGFIQNVTTLATQRFLSMGLGKNDISWTNKAFNTSILVHVAIALFIFLAGETIGLWFVNTHLSIPPDRIQDVSWVFQFSLLALMVQIIQTPYIASIIACERMEVYAKIGILDAFQRWFIVFLLTYFDFSDKLKAYGVLVLCGYLFIFLCYFTFCVKKFDICKLNLKIEKKILKEMFSFSSWTLMGSMSVVALSQGIAILVNIFFGVIANASLGLSDQVLAAINRVTGNFQTAFNPQIIKSYAAGDLEYLKKLIGQSSKLSFALVLLAVVPLFADTQFILSVWLGTVPEYLVSLVRVVTLYVLIDCISGPFVTAIYAVGKLKRYQITISVIILLNLALAFLLVYSHCPLYVVVMARVSSTVFLLAYRLNMLGYLISFNVKEYVFNILSRLIFVSLLSFVSIYYANMFLPESFVGLFVLLLISSFTIIFLFYIIVLSNDEKTFCKQKTNFLYKKFFS
ncbi:MATE family efflux transporter [Hafnia psychrotolerans]|nr:hypothetical protein [Hafnia psychrotolerans]